MIDSKALLEGVTPGDWEVDSGGISSKGNFADVAYVSEGQVYSEYTSDSATLEIPNPADARLIASAPRLARRVIELEEGLVKAERALQRMMDTWLDYHDAHSLTQPVTGASANAFDDALEARDLCAALTIQGEAK